MRQNGLKVRGGANTEDVRTMLEQLGVTDVLATMSLQYVFFLPRTVDPYAQGVQELVKALQRGLVSKGYYVDVDGGLGDLTAAALERVSGEYWYDKNFVQLMGDVLHAPVAKSSRPYPVSGLGASFLGDLAASPLFLIGAGLGAWWWFAPGSFKKTFSLKR